LGLVIGISHQEIANRKSTLPPYCHRYRAEAQKPPILDRNGDSGREYYSDWDLEADLATGFVALGTGRRMAGKTGQRVNCFPCSSLYTLLMGSG